MGLLLFLAQAALPVLQAAPATTPPSGVDALPPTDWSMLSDLHFRRRPPAAPEMSQFVVAEVAAGRCAAPRQSDGQLVLRVDIAVRSSANGQVRRIVPRAIGCPTVEQFAAGLVSRMARDNIDTGGAVGDQWYRIGMTFAWSQ